MGRLVVISGGGTGIGRAAAGLFAADGDHVLLLGRRASVLQQAVRDIEGATRPGAASSFAADLTVPGDVAAVAAQVEATHGAVDVIVNNAGAGGRPPLTGGLPGLASYWRYMYDVNVVSAMMLTETLLPLLRRPGGRIVFVGSMASRNGGGTAAYGAAKAALHGLSMSLAVRLGREGVTSNVVLPGYTPDTEFFATAMPPELHDRIIARNLVGRAGRAEDCAAAIRFLASPAAAFITGQSLEVAGGTRPPNM